MRLLILTQYFPPEIGAPQNRLFELALRLQRKGVDVEVLTAMPNYPKMEIHPNYKGTFYYKENSNDINIYRSWIYVTKSKSIFKRLINYFSFVISSLIIGISKVKNTEVILCESPPLFLGITAFLLKKIKKSKLVFNVSDLWPESAEKLGLVSNKYLLGISTKLEEFLYRNSTFITGQTKGIVSNISNRFPYKKVYWLPNGVDLSFYDNSKTVTNWRAENNFTKEDFILFYAGILGHAQGLEVIMHAASGLKEYANIKFVIFGSGPEKSMLLNLKENLKLSNVFFYESVSKEEMPAIIQAMDVSVIPLKRLDLFKGAIPSKVFENLAMKKPILLGVEGEAKELFITEGECGLAYEPENHQDLITQILELYHNPAQREIFGNNGHKYVSQNFTRDKIANEFLDFLNANINIE